MLLSRQLQNLGTLGRCQSNGALELAHRDLQTDRQTGNPQTDRQTGNPQTDRQTGNRLTDGGNRQINSQRNRLREWGTDRRTGKQTEKKTD